MCERGAVDVMSGVRSPGWLGGGCESGCDGSADKCASIHGRHFTLSKQKRNRDSVRQRKAAFFETPPFGPVFYLEVEAQTKLYDARKVSSGEMHESGAAEAGINRTRPISELSVIK